jgi:hypothetical protein
MQINCRLSEAARGRPAPSSTDASKSTPRTAVRQRDDAIPACAPLQLAARPAISLSPYPATVVASWRSPGPKDAAGKRVHILMLKLAYLVHSVGCIHQVWAVDIAECLAPAVLPIALAFRLLHLIL